MGEKKHGLRRVAGYFVNHRLLNWMPGKPYLQIFYYAEFGKFIDFKNPKTFNCIIEGRILLHWLTNTK